MANLTKYRLGLDVGTNSLGWSVLKLDKDGNPCAIKDAGVRIFADGRDEKSKATLAATRREKRSARRRRDRFKQRQKYLLNALTEKGLFPDEKDNARKALQKLNPLELRARLLSESAADILEKIKNKKDKIGKEASAANLKPEYLIGRALFHINQRRGFKSSRKDRSEETVSGKVSNSARKLLEEMQLIDPPMPAEEYKALSKEDKKQVRQKEAEDRKQAIETTLREQKELSFGKFLYEHHKKKEQTRARPSLDDSKLYDVYPTRELYEDEFDKIWTAQAKHFPKVMKDEVKETVYNVIFHQRKLKPQERGQCAYMNKEKRTFRAMPSFQHYRIYQEVNNLEWRTSDGKHCLRDNHAARDAIINLMQNPSRKEKPTDKNAKITFKTMRTALKKMEVIDDEIQFNFETPKRKGFDGNSTSNVMQHEDYIGPAWHKWALEKQDAFIDIILDDELDDAEVKAHLIKEYGLSETIADNCMNAEARLQDGTANISLKAAQLMLAKMRDGVEDEKGETYLPLQSEAAEIVAEEVEEFVNPMRRPKTDEDEFEPEDSLLYYGEWFQTGSHIIPGKRKPEDRHDDRKYFGGITNPTVHIALNQIRQVTNELIKRHGHPTSIAIELGRNLPEGAVKRNEIDSEQRKNQERNEKLDKELSELGQETTRDNRLRLRLWEECEGFCAYSGKKIGKVDLFNGTTDIDHIIPWSKSLDDSYANKVICTRQANQDKGQKTPWQAFHNNPSGYKWDEILKRAPEAKQWRFQENALKLWDGDNEEVEKAAKKMTEHKDSVVQDIGKQILEKGVSSLNDEQKKIAAEHGIVDTDFSPRHLNDTRYIGRLTREYLESICHIDKIDVITGRLTSLLRGHWGLNNILKELENENKPPKDHNLPEEAQEAKSQKKNRDDHRHHAIDAIVIAMTNRSTLQKVATAANKAEELEIDRLFLKDEKGHSAIDPDYWENTQGEKASFRESVKEATKNIIVSHKARRKKLRKGTTDGQLHNETALGLVECLNKDKNEYRTVVRRPIDYFKDRKHVEAIRDDKLRAEFLQIFDEAVAGRKKGEEGIKDLAEEKNIRHLRCWGPKQAIPIKDKNGKAYKGYQGDSNWGMEIYVGHKKDPEEWEGVVISRFEANHPKFKPGTTHRPHPAARLIMRLQINDCIEIEVEGKKQYMRLQLMAQSGQLFFAPLHEANVDGRNRKGEFKYLRKNAKPLQKLKARKIHISPTGQVSYEKRRKPRRK